MVKSGGFIAGIAEILGLPDHTVTGAFRVLRVSGLMTSGARGVNAPDMTDLDASRMLIAMLVSERPAYSEASARDFGSLICTAARHAQLHPDFGVDDAHAEIFERATKAFRFEARGLGMGHTFEDAVAELIRMYGDDRAEEYWRDSQMDFGERGIFDPHTTIEVVASSLTAKIIMSGNVYEYTDALVDPNSWGDGETDEDISADLDAEEAHGLKMSRYASKIQSVRSIDTIQIAALARMIREAGE